MADPVTNTRVITFGGSKGGTGSTLIATGMAIFLAQLGKRVLYVDAHPQGPCVASHFGAFRSGGALPPWAPSPPEPRGRETVVPNVRVLEATREDGPFPELPLRHPRELVRASGADFALLDMGSGVRTRTLDAMLESDTVVTVTTPEPVAVEAVWRLVRHLYARRLSERLRTLDDPGAPDALAALVRAHAGPPAPVDLANAIAARSQQAAAASWGELSRLRVRLIVNQSRSRADLELGEAIVRVGLRRMGPVLEFMGHVEYDDAAFLAARRKRPLLVDAPSAKASRNLERVARRLLSLDVGRGATSSPAPEPSEAPAPPTHYDLLAIDRGASDEEIRRAYRKTREVYATESVCLAGLMTDEEVSSIVARVEEARDVLLDPSRRRPYDLSIAPVGVFSMATRFDDEPDVTETAAPSRMPDITPDTEFTGPILKAVREARNVDLRDVAARTKISLPYLRALEEDDFGALPQSVYTRGFVIEYAKFLRLDVDQVVRTWFRRYRRSLER